MIELCLLGALAFISPQDPARVRAGPFSLECRVDHKRAAADAQAVIEAVWKRGADLYGVDLDDFKRQRRVTLHESTESYQEMDRRLTGGKFQRNLAFAHFGSQSAHVALQPKVNDAELIRAGLPLLTCRLLAHEAAHLIRYGALRNYRSHPQWIVHGSASYLDREAVREMGRLATIENDPDASKSLLRVQKMIAKNQLPSVKAILTTDLDDFGFYERYDVYGLFFTFLQERHRDSLRSVLRGLRRLGGGKGLSKKLYKVFVSEFGKDATAELNAEFTEYVIEMTPQWDEVFRSLEVSAAGFRQTSFAKTNAICWRVAAPTSSSYKISGRVRITPGDKQQMNLLLGRGAAGFVSVAFVAGSGIQVFCFDAKTQRWDRLSGNRIDDLVPAKEISFTVSVKNRELSITVAGHAIPKITVEKIDLSGAWGLGAQAGSAGTWTELRAPGL